MRGRPWTVAKLAGATGISRAALARRFDELVGTALSVQLAGLTASLVRLAAFAARDGSVGCPPTRSLHLRGS